MESDRDIYINNDIERKLASVREWMEEREEGIRVLIGVDFNARTGREVGRERGRRGEMKRKVGGGQRMG